MFCYEECWLFDTHLYRTQAARHGKKVPITLGSQIARLTQCEDAGDDPGSCEPS